MDAPRQLVHRPITAKLLNDHADLIDLNSAGFDAPRDATPPAVPNEQPAAATGAVTWTANAKTVVTVRVENPSDSSQFVDDERHVTLMFQNAAGETMILKGLDL